MKNHKTKFALRRIADGYAICDAETGKFIDGQTEVAVATQPGVTVTTVTLNLLNLPFYEEERSVNRAYTRFLRRGDA